MGIEVWTCACVLPSEATLDMAEQMAQVGIVPSAAGPEQEPIGHRFELAGQPFVVTGYATREEFLDAVERAGFPVAVFRHCPDGYHFQRVSTD